MSDMGNTGATRELSDTEKLHQLGYAQELHRGMSAFSNFAVSFTIISILSGCLTLFSFGMNTGGPMTMIWGWLLVGVFVVMVGLGMAEVCSSYPTAGGLYYWAAKLAPKKNAPLWSWFTGWFNLLGQVAVTAGIDFGCGLFITGLLQYMNVLSPTVDFHTTQHEVVLITLAILVAHGLLNSFGVDLVAKLANVSVWWHVIGVAIIVAVLFIAPTHHSSMSFIFTHFVNNTGFRIPIYVFLIGLLNAQYTLTGYDASAHMTEETHNAAIAGPKGIVMSIVVSLVAGWVLLVGVSYAIQPGKYTTEAGSLIAPGQIFVDALGKTGGELLLLIAIIAQFFCGMSSVTANSRMIYAFSRDGAVPGHRLWHKINPRTRTPTNAIWLACAGAFILVIPYWVNTAAYAAVTSIAVVGLYVAYIIPVYLRVRSGDSFEKGPWNLGKWGMLNGVIATVWVVFICILLMMPQLNPITKVNFNYAPVAVLAVIGFALIYWVVSARKWFTGPKIQGSAEELAAIERELTI